MSAYRTVGGHDDLPLVALREARSRSPEMDVSSRIPETSGRPEGYIIATQHDAGDHERYF